MAYFTREPTALARTPERRLSALRQDCGVFCFVAVARLNNNRWRVTHGERQTILEDGDIESAQAWIKALHFMTKSFDRRIDCRILTSFGYEGDDALVVGLDPLAPDRFVGAAKFKARLETVVTDDEFEMIVQCHTAMLAFEILDPAGRVMAKARIVEFQTYSGYATDTGQRVGLDFVGDSFV